MKKMTPLLRGFLTGALIICIFGCSTNDHGLSVPGPKPVGPVVSIPGPEYNSGDCRSDIVYPIYSETPLRTVPSRPVFASPKTENASGDTTEDTAALRVSTFNIRYDNGHSTGTNAWNHPTAPRRECALALIRDIDPHLLGVQEALKNQMDDLSEGLPDYSAVGCGRDDGMRKGEYSALFFRMDRFTLRDSGHFWLSPTPDVPGTVFRGSGSIRMATWIIVHDRIADRDLFVLNTHWDNESQSSRELSAELIRKKCMELSDGKAVIVMGDLNQEESNNAVTSLMSDYDESVFRLKDTYRAVHPIQMPAERTYHAFEGATDGVRIDFIFHTSSLSAMYAEIRTNRCDGGFPSDHYPVMAQLQWTDLNTGTSIRFLPGNTAGR